MDMSTGFGKADMTPEIHAKVIELCAVLGLDPSQVARIEIHPDYVMVSRYRPAKSLGDEA